jgi:heme A synthase
MTEKTNKFSRRTVALLWLLAVAIVIGILLYLEQIAVLYVLASVALVALLLIVGFSDLERIGTDNSREGFGGSVE